MEGEEDEDEQASRRGLGGLVMSNIVDISRHHRLSLLDPWRGERMRMSKPVEGWAVLRAPREWKRVKLYLT